jgi:dipeptidyl aminopeptidase/acylaminoacyl peptidase
LANRGYAVLSVNFRGSTGFGKNFLNAGNGEWGGKMQDDLIDAVNWAIKQKIAEPTRIAIMGTGYGGYATIAGLTFTPDVFACGVNMCGPLNLVTLLESIPPQFEAVLKRFSEGVGDHRTEEGKKLLTERSPLTHADRITKPLLIAHGDLDRRVKKSETEQIVDILLQKGVPVVYTSFENEGHGLARPEHNKAFLAVAEAFLAKYLGGRHEPMGEDLKDSKIVIPQGAKTVPGLSEALSQGG